MIRQLVLASCLVAVVFSACKTVGPAMGGSCPPELALVNNEGREECTAAANVAACGGTVTPSNTGCQDAEATLCPSWVEKGYCTSNMYTTDQKKASCAKSCGLC